MKTTAIGLVVGAVALTPCAAPAVDLWDNGPPDGSDGYQNGTDGPYGGRRALLDDFVIPDSIAGEMQAAMEALKSRA